MSRDLLGDGVSYLSCPNGDAINLLSAWTACGWWKHDSLLAAEIPILSFQYDGSSHINLPLSFGYAQAPLTDVNYRHYAGFYRGATAPVGWNSVLGSLATVGSWYHLAGSWDGTSLRIYENGALVNTATPPTLPLAATAGADVYAGGNWYLPNADSMDGKIAEVAAWNVALSLPEIAALAKGVSPALIRKLNLKVYVPVHGVASPEADLSGSGMNFSLLGTGPRAEQPLGGRVATFAAG